MSASSLEPTGNIFGLVGSPNAGKTTLFNALTGMRARVGNYPGVTVERREASLPLDGITSTLIDLPGTYGLEPISADEAVVGDVLEGRIEGITPPDALIVVADACSLSRSLPFIGESMHLGRPVCVVLTMLDELAARGGKIDLERFEAAEDSIASEKSSPAQTNGPRLRSCRPKTAPNAPAGRIQSSRT